MSTKSLSAIFGLFRGAGVVAAAILGPVGLFEAVTGIDLPEPVLAEGIPTVTQNAGQTVVPAITEVFVTDAPLTPTETLVPATATLPATATEAPRDIICGPACEKLDAVSRAAAVYPGYESGFEWLWVEYADADNCVGYHEYANPDGTPSGEFASCLDLSAGGMNLCNPNAGVAWQEDSCLGGYTLAVFRIEGLVLSDIPYYDFPHFGGWMFPSDILVDEQYHLGGGYLPLVFPGDFTANDIDAMREKFLCVYEWEIADDPTNGDYAKLADHLVAAYSVGTFTGNVIRTNTSISDPDVGGARMVIENLPLYWTDSLNPADCP